MKYKRDDIAQVIMTFQESNNPTDRYASFDYCYNYFRKNNSQEIIENKERSCLTLGFYLASWGMLRGSSFLLSKSVKFYQPLIEYIGKIDKNVWTIDIDNMEEENLQTVLSIYNDIKNITIENKNNHLTLVTKIMLGVFGFIPAFDQYFGNTFRDTFGSECGFRAVNKNSLKCIRKFYLDNKEEIDLLSEATFTKNFQTGQLTDINYPKAKIIDMYGFQKGFLLSV